MKRSVNFNRARRSGRITADSTVDLMLKMGMTPDEIRKIYTEKQDAARKETENNGKELQVGGKKIESNGIKKCLRCGCQIDPTTDSGWEAFTSDGVHTQPICKECDLKESKSIGRKADA